MNKERMKTIAFWICTILGPTSFVIGGFLNITQSEQAIIGLQHLGYPLYFAYILGFWKLAGAVTITIPGFPKLKEWAYAGFVFDLTGAAASHYFKGDPFFNGSNAQIASPLIFLALVLASYFLRPTSRKIG